MSIKTTILVWLRYHAKNTKLQRWLEKKIANSTGSYFYSQVIRDIYKELHGLEIGYGTYGGCWNNSALWWNNIVIGRYCSFSGNIYCGTENHPMTLFTTHPITYNMARAKANKTRHFSSTHANSLTIGHDVWMGDGAIILAGCNTVGNGAIIGAGAVVTKDVPPYAIVAGNPAKILRYRLSPDQIAKVEASKWWLLDKDELNERMDEFLALTK